VAHYRMAHIVLCPLWIPDPRMLTPADTLSEYKSVFQRSIYLSCIYGTFGSGHQRMAYTTRTVLVR